MTLKSRLEALEKRQAGPVQIFVTYDGGETYGHNGRTYTRAECEVMPDWDKARVIEVEYTDQVMSDDTSNPIAET